MNACPAMNRSPIQGVFQPRAQCTKVTLTRIKQLMKRNELVSNCIWFNCNKFHIPLNLDGWRCIRSVIARVLIKHVYTRPHGPTCLPSPPPPRMRKPSRRNACTRRDSCPDDIDWRWEFYKQTLYAIYLFIFKQHVHGVVLNDKKPIASALL